MRTTSAVTRKAKKKKILALAVGLRGRKKNCVDLAKGPVQRRKMAISEGRFEKRRAMSTQWILRISAFSRMMGHKYSTLIPVLKEIFQENFSKSAICHILSDNQTYLEDLVVKHLQK